MTAPLATRLAAGPLAVVLRREVASVLAITEDRAELLCARVAPLRTPGPHGVLRYTLGDLLEADRREPEAPRVAPSLPMADVRDYQPRRRKT